MKNSLEKLYARYNRREFVHPDPLEFLYSYPEVKDREIVGLIASSLAYGRVEQILKSVRKVLERIGKPSMYVRNTSYEKIKKTFADFRHRFTAGEEVASLLYGAGQLIDRYGSLGDCFVQGVGRNDETIIPALDAFVRNLDQTSGVGAGSLIPRPSKGSACKRLHLFLRWMIRCDEVDPGGWRGMSPSKLLVPLDTHMHRLSLKLGFTKRKQADIHTALEITEAFRSMVPHDPVRYDFSLTRLGIRTDADDDDIKKQFKF